MSITYLISKGYKIIKRKVAITRADERKKLSDGTENPKYVDVLDEDEGIAGQKFSCMSFLSPDKILEKREMFLFEMLCKRRLLSFQFIVKTNKITGGIFGNQLFLRQLGCSSFFSPKGPFMRVKHFLSYHLI